ncbi:MAG TPA: TolC family protein [Longimicrobium sp.]|nr:TolC family protein [Longimicrobium sp.]
MKPPPGDGPRWLLMVGIPPEHTALADETGDPGVAAEPDRDTGATDRPGRRYGMNRSSIAAAAAFLLACAPLGVHAQQAPRAAAAASADTVSLTLDAALTRALGESDEIRLARSEVGLANAEVRATRAQALPQLSANVAYTRTFASPFGGGGGGITLPDSLRFSPDSTLSLAQRVSYLERNTPNAGLMGIGSLFSGLPFGQENTYTATLSGSQTLFSGGRTGAALRIARSYRSAAELTLVEREAEITLQVRTAYTQAQLAQELSTIARAALEQAEAFLAQERLRQRAGESSDLEVLRAEVSRDNLRPQLVQAENAAQLAQLELKRLLNIPAGQPVRLTSPLDAPAQAAAEADAALATAGRASVAAAEQQVAMREEGIRIARGAFLPTVSLQAHYGRQLQPTSMFAFGESWRGDAAATLNVSVPIFSGGQRTAELQQARLEAERARLQLSQLREGVQVEYEQARGEAERARTAITARQTTVQAAQRVYDLTVLRYQRGLATQLEVSQSRLELLQARSNLAQAIADLRIAAARVQRATGGTAQ